MNVAFVVHNYDRREGTGGYTVEILERVAREHDVTLYAAGVRTAAPAGVRVVRVPAFRSPAYGTILTFPAAFASVRGRHDLVHAQGWVTGRATVVTAHIVLEAWRRAARAARVRPPAGERLLGGFVARHEAALLRSAPRVIAPSERVKRDLEAEYGRTESVAVIPHGFDRALTLPSRVDARRALGIATGDCVGLYVGDPRKGLEAALQALARLDGGVLLVLGHSAAGPWLARAVALGVRARVVWAEPGAAVAGAMAAADLLVHPTIYDTFALPVAEAMAHGLPVVVSREAGVAELIEHQRSAWLLDSGDPAELATAWSALARDDALRQRLAEGGRRLAAEWTWDRAARETMDVYRAAVAS